MIMGNWYFMDFNDYGDLTVPINFNGRAKALESCHTAKKLIFSVHAVFLNS